MPSFEQYLKGLFDAQDFFREPALDAMLNAGTAIPIADDDLEQLFAAGDPLLREEHDDDRT